MRALRRRRFAGADAVESLITIMITEIHRRADAIESPREEFSGADAIESHALEPDRPS